MEQVTCQYCGKVFYAPKSKNRKYCSHSCAAKDFNRKGILKPYSSKLKLTKEELERLHEQMGMERIAKKLNVSVGTIQYWLKKFGIPSKHNRRFVTPNLSSSPELSYVIGALLGDGYIAKKKSKKDNNLVQFFSTDPLLLGVFNSAVCKVLRRTQPYKIRWEKRPPYKDMGKIVMSSLTFWEFMRKPLDELLEIASKYPAQFIRGFFDAEASVYLVQASTQRYYIRCSNSNLKILKFIQNLLKTQFGIKSIIRIEYKEGSTFRSINNKIYTRKVTTYSLEIYERASVLNYFLHIGFSTPRKIPFYSMYVDELKLDYDTKHPQKRMSIPRIKFVAKLLRLPIVDVIAHRSANGVHIRLKLKEKMHPLLAVLAQALMGSDYGKEAYDGLRVLNLMLNPFRYSQTAHETWNVLFEKKYVQGELVSQEVYDEKLTRKLRRELGCSTLHA